AMQVHTPMRNVGRLERLWRNLFRRIASPIRRPATKLPPSELKATKAEDKGAVLAANWSSSNAARDPSTTTTIGRSGVSGLTVTVAATAGVVTNRIDAIEMQRRIHPR